MKKPDRSKKKRPESRLYKGRPIVTGADIELGNFIQGLDLPGGTGARAASALLREFPGHCRDEADDYPDEHEERPTPELDSWDSFYPERHTCSPGRLSDPADSKRHKESNNRGNQDRGYGYGYHHQTNLRDWGRKYLPTKGGCAYIDLGHLELCVPEVVSAFDHVAAWYAMMLTAAKALRNANAKLPAGQKIKALVNNSDGQDNSYGSHCNFLVSRRCYDNIFERKLHHMLFLASYQAGSIVFTGAGKAGSENRLPDADYQISQRADFFETLAGEQTTYRRPIVNSRDEPLCGTRSYFRSNSKPDDLARLHVIFFDNNLCQTACLLKIGVTQLILAMLEQDHIFPELILDDPLNALHKWSRDPNLNATAKTIDGQKYTIVEYQNALFNRVRQFVKQGKAEGYVPRWHEIMSIWHGVLDLLNKKDFNALSRKLDWALKWNILKRMLHNNRKLNWQSPQIKFLDHIYSSLEHAEGLFWSYQKKGLVDSVVMNGHIKKFIYSPPENTRAWLRANLIRKAEAEQIESIDWDKIEFKFKTNGSIWSPCKRRELKMNDPLRFTKKECESLLNQNESLEVIVEKLKDENSSGNLYIIKHLRRNENETTSRPGINDAYMSILEQKIRNNGKTSNLKKALPA